MNVTHVEKREWDKDGTIVKVTDVTFDDGRTAPGYDLPQEVEVGKPLPQGWEVATAKSGKLYIKVPKAGGGGGGAAAYRNTKEGQAYEQERMDRRTALMQASALAAAPLGSISGGPGGVPGAAALALETADYFYAWLRKTAGVGAGIGTSASRGSEPTAPPAPAAPPAGQARVGRPAESQDHAPNPQGKQPEPSGAVDTARASGPQPSATASGACDHSLTSPLKPDGNALPDGFVRCLSCGKVQKEATA